MSHLIAGWCHILYLPGKTPIFGIVLFNARLLMTCTHYTAGHWLLDICFMYVNLKSNGDVASTVSVLDSFLIYITIF
jgi:uncharacterized membrane protein YbhN (UPF0104 family)